MKLIAFLMLSALPCVLEAAPRAEDVAAYRELISEDQRLARVGHRIAEANARFCPKTVRSLGFTLHDIAQYPSPDLARAAFGFEVPIQISAIVDEGAAKRAGLQVNDGLIEISTDEGHVRFAKPSNRAYRLDYKRMELLAIGLDALLAKNNANRVNIIYLRDGKEASAVIEPVSSCASKFHVDTKNGLDAGADGERVRITVGLLRFTANDDELASVVAHELAHNILGHRARLDRIQRGKTKAILATEIEADRLSVWLMANAGYDPNGALTYWQRYGPKTGLGILSAGTHLRWKNRIKLMQAEIDLMAQTPKQDGTLPPPLLNSG